MLELVVVGEQTSTGISVDAKPCSEPCSHDTDYACPRAVDPLGEPSCLCTTRGTAVHTAAVRQPRLSFDGFVGCGVPDRHGIGFRGVELEELEDALASRMLPRDFGAVHCQVDVCRALVQSEDSSEYGREIVERIRRLMKPEVLDRFHDILCTARHLPVGRAKALPKDWEVGDHIYFGHAYETARLELIDEAGRTWAAIDNHCPRSGCACADTLIEVYRFVREPLGMHEPLGAIFVSPDGKWDLKPLTREGLVLRDVWRCLQERWGDVPRELARRRGILREIFGPMVQIVEQTPPTAPKLASTSPIDASARRSRTGRNEPCPCGSGRKYKRCCGSSEQ